ncbi:MAG TPA: hypothetical protein VG929_08860 [Actinomycetota bacterium]|nr:hypothetical protein [Actinomycetota bacterium]
MKKIVVLLMVVGLVAGSIATAEAGKKKKKKPARVERVAESKYEAPAIGAPSAVGVCFRPTNSCGDIATGAGEVWVRIDIKDASGTATAFTFGQDTDPNTPGTETIFGDFCGTTGDDLVQIQEGLPLVVFPWAFGDVLCPGAFGTQGTITATLSNLP